jgi:hypothetical protein
MSAVEARFYISGYERNSYDPSATVVKMNVVSRGEHNKNWAAATPSGQVTMTIKNESAASWFVNRLGAEVGVTFSSIEADDQ